MKTEWTELMFMQIRAGNTAIYVFLLAILCVSSWRSGGALYEKLVVAAGRHSGGSVMPAVFGMRRLVDRIVGQYFRADRIGGSGWAGM